MMDELHRPIFDRRGKYFMPLTKKASPTILSQTLRDLNSLRRRYIEVGIQPPVGWWGFDKEAKCIWLIRNARKAYDLENAARETHQ